MTLTKWMFESHPNVYVDVLTPNMRVWRGRGLWEAFRFTGGLEGGASWWGWCPCRKSTRSPHNPHQGTAVCTNSERAVCKPGRGTPQRIGSASTSLVHVSASRTERNTCLLLEPPSLRCFVIAVWADWEGGHLGRRKTKRVSYFGSQREKWNQG